MKERAFDARRRGAIKALKAVRQLARDLMDSPQAEADVPTYAAYEDIYEAVNQMIVDYEEKTGAEIDLGPNWKNSLWEAYQAACDINNQTDEESARFHFEKWFRNIGRPSEVTEA